MMQRNPWLEEANSIIILPSGVLGEELLQMAQELSFSGLIGQAFWVLPNDQEPNLDNSKIQATIFGRSKKVEVDLFAQLAADTLLTLRLVTLRTVNPEALQDAKQTQVINGVDRLLEIAVPVTSGFAGSTNDGTVLKRINLMVSSSSRKDIDFTPYIQTGWSYNVIIAPEDRLTPWGIDQFVTQEKNLLGLALTNIATAGGLWVGIPKGIYESLEHNASGAPGQIWLQRTFGRGVLSEGLALSQSSLALKKAISPDANYLRAEIGLQPPNISEMPSESIAGRIEEILEAVFAFENGALTFHVPNTNLAEPRREIGLITQVKEFFGFALDKLISIPGWIFNSIVNRVSDKATQVFHGEDGDANVDVSIDFKRARLDRRDQELFNQTLELEKMKAEGRANRNEDLSKLVVHSSPSLWRDLRLTFFSNLDGSLGPESLPIPEKEGRALLIGKPTDLIFDPRDFWSSSENLRNILSIKPSPTPLSLILNWENISSADEFAQSFRSEIAAVELEIVSLKSNIYDLANETLRSTENTLAVETDPVDPKPEKVQMSSDASHVEMEMGGINVE